MGGARMVVLRGNGRRNEKEKNSIGETLKLRTNRRKQAGKERGGEGGEKDKS